MSAYLVAKWLHVLSSTVLFGTGIGSAYYLFFASRGGDPRVIAHVARRVVIADWLFTTTTIVFQPLSGLYLAHVARFPLTSFWIVASFALYVIAGACWMPVVLIQMRMQRIAEDAAARGAPLPPLYGTLFAVWTALGIPAFLALVVVFWLMVAKPA